VKEFLLKKLVPVEIISATIWFKNESLIAFLAEDSLIYKITVVEQPEFKKFSLDEGTTVWLYYIPINRKVSGVIPQDATPKDQLPAPLPVEIEVCTKEARY
jgi:hypothetical protein